MVEEAPSMLGFASAKAVGDLPWRFLQSCLG